MELSCRRHRKVELERVGQQEHAVDRRTALEVGKLHCIELADERARPVVEHIGDGHVVGDRKGEVQVGEAVPATEGKRAHDGASDDPLITVREPEQALTERIALLNGEHGPRF